MLGQSIGDSLFPRFLFAGGCDGSRIGMQVQQQIGVPFFRADMDIAPLAG